MRIEETRSSKKKTAFKKLQRFLSPKAAAMPSFFLYLPLPVWDSGQASQSADSLPCVVFLIKIIGFSLEDLHAGLLRVTELF
jgi:hypothetical protein